MAALKCMNCKRWTMEQGCSIEAVSYSRYKSCVLGQMNFYMPKEPEVENSDDLRRQNEEESR